MRGQIKNLKEIQDRLKMELKQWYINQINNPFEDYYLYYLESTPGHDGGIAICKEKPANPEYQLSARINKGAKQERARIVSDIRKQAERYVGDVGATLEHIADRIEKE